MSVTIGFKVEEKFKKELQKIADKEDRTISNLIKHVLKRYMKDYNRKDKR